MLRAQMLVGLVCLSACGAPASHPGSAEPPAPSGAPTPSRDPDLVGESPAKPRAKQPLPIHSSCPEVVTIVLGEDPKAEGAGRRSIAPSGSIEGPRDAEGKQTISLVDDHGEVVARVRVNRGMKAVEIGRSCRTLDAR